MLCLTRSGLLSTLGADESVCALQALKSVPVASTGHRNPLFESVVSSPQTVFIVVPEENVCQQQSFYVLSVQQ